MKEYDIVVVGGRSAGCSAAKTAAEKGAKVIVIEQHPIIGTPRHCTAILLPSDYHGQILEAVNKTYGDVTLMVMTMERLYGPSGKLIQEFPTSRGCRMIRREEFDRAWGRLAATAGAEIVLNTRVTGLMKENGKIVGVTTSSRAMPEVKCKLVIAASGAPSTVSGIPAQEGLVGTGREVTRPNLQLELTNVKGVAPGVGENWYSAGLWPGRFMWWPINENSIIAGVGGGLETLERIKTADHPLSYRLRGAQLLQIFGSGASAGMAMGLNLPKTIKDGLILVGNAAGFSGMITAVLTGRYAAEVAVEAIQAGDVTEAKLKRDEEWWKDIGLVQMYERPNIAKQKVKELLESKASDEEMESALIEMLRPGEAHPLLAAMGPRRP